MRARRPRGFAVGVELLEDAAEVELVAGTGMPGTLSELVNCHMARVVQPGGSGGGSWL